MLIKRQLGTIDFTIEKNVVEWDFKLQHRVNIPAE